MIRKFLRIPTISATIAVAPVVAVTVANDEFLLYSEESTIFYVSFFKGLL